MLTEQQFLSDVSNHRMSIIRDDGVNRHIRFKQSDTINMQFDLITWDGHLCYTGDMGTYVFKRLPDMFEFFRTDRAAHGSATLKINPCYWAEKLEAKDVHGGCSAYSQEKFCALITELVATHIVEEGLSTEDAQTLRDIVDEEILSDCDDIVSAYQAASEFEYDQFSFSDFFEYDLEEYTPHYMWCCYALAWGILQYDTKELKNE